MILIAVPFTAISVIPHISDTFHYRPCNEVQDWNQNMQIFQAGNENFLDLNIQILNYDSIPSQCVPCVMPTSLWRRLLRLPWWHGTRSWCLPARIIKFIQQVFGRCIICTCVWRHCLALHIGWCALHLFEQRMFVDFVVYDDVVIFKLSFPQWLTHPVCFVVADSSCFTCTGWQVIPP